MSRDVLDKVKQLPLDKQREVEDFIEYLLDKYAREAINETLSEKRKSNMGRMKGEIWIAEDFDVTPEDFKDYI